MTVTYDVADELCARLATHDESTVAVIGLAKNVGKTVMLKTLLRGLGRRNEVVALVSLGRDGERLDALDDRIKPRIVIDAGTFAVVARAALWSVAGAEMLELLPVQSAVGELVLIRAITRLEIELVGPRFAQDVARLVTAVRKYHAGMVLIDGAFDRMAALARIHPAVIVVTGAGVDRRSAIVVDKTEALLRRLCLPNISEIAPTMRPPDVYIHVGAFDEIDAAKLLAADQVRAICIDTPFAITAGAFAKLRKHVTVCVKRSVRVVACGVNATARDWDFEPQRFLHDIRSVVEIQTVDCLRNVSLP